MDNQTDKVTAAVEPEQTAPSPEATSLDSALPSASPETVAADASETPPPSASAVPLLVTSSESEIPETLGEEIGQKEAGLGAGWIILIAAVLLVALASVVALILRKRKEDAAGKGETGSYSATTITAMDKMDEPSKTAVQNAAYSVGGAQTIGSRQNQEDSFGGNWKRPESFQTHGLLAIVADGIGGLENGQIASNTTVRAMCATYDQLSPATAPDIALLKMLGAAQEEVLELNHSGMRTGSTLVAALVKDRRLSILSVGDSRIALYRGGMLLTLNREHVLGREMDENEILNDAWPDTRKRTALNAYIGKENLRMVDRTLEPMRLLQGDRVLLMSDGIFGTLSDDEIVSAITLPPQQAAEKIVEMTMAKRKPHQDNATVVVIGVN